jgi:elongation factor P
MESIKATQLRIGMVILYQNTLYKIINVMHLTPGNKRGFIQAKLRNLREGNTIDVRFRSEDFLSRPILEQKEMEYLYEANSVYYFMDVNSYEQIEFEFEKIKEITKFLVPNIKVFGEFFKGEAIGLMLPPTVNLKVVSTEPTLKGATATASSKPATLETGLVIQVPPFIQAGDIVKVNTESSTYEERVR